MLKDFDHEKANELCSNFTAEARKINADVPTMLLAAIRLFVTIVKVVTVPDPKTGRRKERILQMIPMMIESYDEDFPIDDEKGGAQ